MDTKKKSLIYSLEIRNFKMFDSFSLKDLKRINLIYGKNNSGKTGLLEGIYLSLSTVVPNSIFSVFRGFPFSFSSDTGESSWGLIFNKFNNIEPINILIEFKKALFQ